MTIRQLYDNLLSELNKVEAPSILLEDFVYFANKAVQQYVNKVYNRYDINQQSTDDLRSLKTTTQLTVENDDTIAMPTEDAYWFVYLPEDYLHILNCIVVFEKDGYVSESKCDIKEKTKVNSLARRLTSDTYPQIMNNAYFKPSYKTPYYFITDFSEDSNAYKSFSNELETALDPNKPVEKESFKLEIRCGSTTKYVPTSVFIDYLRVPTLINLTYNDLESDQDNTSRLEFPEYVCYEIVNDCVRLIMENISDPRIETNTAINQTIGTNVSQNK
jgi:hypothetical protein